MTTKLGWKLRPVATHALYLLVLLAIVAGAAPASAASAASTSAPSAPSTAIYIEELAVIVVGYSLLILVILTKYRSR